MRQAAVGVTIRTHPCHAAGTHRRLCIRINVQRLHAFAFAPCGRHHRHSERSEESLLGVGACALTAKEAGRTVEGEERFLGRGVSLEMTVGALRTVGNNVHGGCRDTVGSRRMVGVGRTVGMGTVRMPRHAAGRRRRRHSDASVPCGGHHRRLCIHINVQPLHAFAFAPCGRRHRHSERSEESLLGSCVSMERASCGGKQKERKPVRVSALFAIRITVPGSGRG